MPIGVDFEGRLVVVTGAAGNLGRAVVAMLKTLNADVQAPKDPADGGPDLARESAVHLWYRRHPTMWASVNLAGGFAMTDIGDTNEDMLQHMWRMNARSCFLCCREAIRIFRVHGGGGRIVNVSARAALEPRNAGGMVAYALSKSAVATMTEAIGEEVARENIFVNSVAPSILDTEENRRAQPDADYSSWVTLEAAAQAITFLASPQNQAIRSANIPLYATG
ncbi:MAG: SDR family NAD(P)-dependent oxidoreductase [Rhodospirillales bacterium]|nr:SDR family NAD(P)-dependent oxidoreductase [Rhodospirillales bacterium]MCY3854802.1 SDR family NAD(P)-dependent oxidoreductase [Rhodospirillales bacterium]MCY4003183.1 SDR family NAD(P)-dependent oxidoreductase [Rhodospirillales bacterium]MCY4099078.1 SDR family NAD(P)-dependent oxidoreductase [Rhodospirillales bacterium]MDE0372445.1 SDR family NAD(P)-dependent oxidoreductase [Rhodospirillales bacterium]